MGGDVWAESDEGKGSVFHFLEKSIDEQDPFDICITDIQMPNMSGCEVARQIRLRTSIRSLPLLALSSTMERDAKRCGEIGFDGFLTKPVRRERLYRMLEKEHILSPPQGGDSHPLTSRRIPIIAMTAHAMKGDQEICIDAGMDDYVAKPIKRDVVFSVVEKWAIGERLYKNHRG